MKKHLHRGENADRRRARHRAYYARVRAERRELARRILGTKCGVCGVVVEAGGHLHHLDPELKAFKFCHMEHVSLARFLEELRHAAVVCPACHGRITWGAQNGVLGADEGVPATIDDCPF